MQDWLLKSPVLSSSVKVSNLKCLAMYLICLCLLLEDLLSYNVAFGLIRSVHASSVNICKLAGVFFSKRLLTFWLKGEKFQIQLVYKSTDGRGDVDLEM